MLKKRIIGLLIILIITCLCANLALADVVPYQPYLRLSVEPSPLMSMLPSKMYVAQLSYMPGITSTPLVADFYNINPNATTTDPTSLEYLGSVPFDKTGRAALIKVFTAGEVGYFVAIAKTVIDGRVIWSNKVGYKLP